MIDFETRLLPVAVPLILTLTAAFLMLAGKHHTRNVKLLHFLGRLYLALVYLFSVLLNLNNEDIQSFARAGVSFLFLEEIVVWLIETKWPLKKSR